MNVVLVPYLTSQCLINVQYECRPAGATCHVEFMCTLQLATWTSVSNTWDLTCWDSFVSILSPNRYEYNRLHCVCIMLVTVDYFLFIIKINIEHYQAYHLTAQWAYLSVFLSLPHFDVIAFFLSECFRAKGVESFSSSVPSIPNPFPELSKSPVLISSFPPQSSDKHVSVLFNQLIQRSKVTL